MNQLDTAQAKPLRVGAVNYLNTKPLVHGLAELLPTAEVCFDLPSRLAEGLAAGELDVALVPSIALAEHPEWSIVSNACIGCRGPVLSVKVMFRVPPAEVCSLALDEGSRTSAVLAQILLYQLYGIRPVLTSLPIGASPSEAVADAVLVIGDRAIGEEEEGFVEVWDLGDRWCRWAELPFVFAMWVARAGVETSELAVALRAARDAGCREFEAIATEQAAKMRLPVGLVSEYLQNNLYFYLDAKQLEGLDFFYQEAAQLGLISSAPKVIRDDCATENC